MWLRAVLFSLAVALGLTAPAHGQGVALNLITAVDVSDSVSPEDFDLQMEGLALGVTDERFLAELGDGVGFEVFIWSSGPNSVETIIAPTLIRNAGDAQQVAGRLRTLQRPPMSYDSQYPSRSGKSRSYGATDISGAIDAAIERALARPSGRTVINVLTDGVDNYPTLETGGAEFARDRALAMGMTVNAIIFGEAADQESYFWEQVITGPGAFVETAETPAEVIPALGRKFWQDMVASVGGSR